MGELPDLPIVVLEATFPEVVGRPGLFDFYMNVGNTGIVFIAALPGFLREWGAEFPQYAVDAAYRRAGSTLAQWGIVSGDTFGFLAQAAKLSVADLSARYGVPEVTLTAWINNQIPVEPSVWQCLAYLVCSLDGRNFLPNPPASVPPPSLRPRQIRVFPTLPMSSMPQSAPPGCPPPAPCGCPPSPPCGC